MQSPNSKEEALKRLAYIEGHLKGIRKMVEEDVYCVDILKQAYAVRRAIEKLEAQTLRGHLNSCVPAGFREGRAQEIVDELAEWKPSPGSWRRASAGGGPPAAQGSTNQASASYERKTRCRKLY